MNPVIRWGRRVVPRGAEGSAVEAGSEVRPGGEDSANRKDEAYEAYGFPDVATNNESESSGDERSPMEPGVAERIESNGGEGEQKIALSDDDLRDILHGGRSLSVTMLAAIILLAIDLLGPSEIRMSRVAMAAGGYATGLLLTFLAVRSALRKREAILPPDRLGDGRIALALAACAFVVSWDEAGVRLAGWFAVAALGIGGWADGVWIATVSARRRLGYWRTLLELIVREGAARRHYWGSMFGEGRT